MTNPFASGGGNLSGFATDIVPVTPSDSADILEGSVALAIICKGSAGNVAITTAKGTSRVYPIAAGETLPVGASRVLSTGTTATTLWAFIA